MSDNYSDSPPLTPNSSPMPAEMKSVEVVIEAWIQERQIQQNESARLIWGRYVRRLRVQARAYLISQSMGGRDRDNVAFRTANAMFEASEKQELDPNERTSDLWKILLVRAAHHIRAREPSEANSIPLAEILGESPSADLCIRFAEELEQTVRSRLDDQLRNVLFLRLEGCVNREIATRLGKQEAEVEPQLAELCQRFAASPESRV